MKFEKAMIIRNLEKPLGTKGALSEIFNYLKKFSNNTNLKGFRKNLLG